MFRRYRLAVVVPLVLALSACAEKAPLTTLDPKGPKARAIDNLVNPVFLIAGIVFVLVQGGVLFLAWRFRKRKDDDGSLPTQTHGNFKLEIGFSPSQSSPPSKSVSSCSPASVVPRCSPCSTSSTSRPTRSTSR